MIDTTTVGRTIAFLRKQKQMTQQGLAAAVNVSHQAVSKWENGVALPDMQTMLALSRLFGVSMEDILSGVVLEEEDIAAKRPEAPAIELKLDADPLNMNIVVEADEVIERAMENCEEIEEPEEPEEPAEPAASETEKTVNVGMTLDEILRMAPYVSRDTLDIMLRSCEEEYSMSDLAAVASFASKDTMGQLVAGCRHMDWDALRRLSPFLSRDALRNVLVCHVDTLSQENLRRLAPFLSRDGLAEILDRMPPTEDFAALRRLAPFLSRDALSQQLERCIERLTVDDLLAFAPYLRKEALGELVQKINQPIDRSQMIRLAKYLPRDQMDRLVYRAMGMKQPKKSSSDWDVSIDLGRAYHEIRDAVHTGMQEAREAMRMVGFDNVMDGINNTMKDMGERINDAFSGSRSQPQRPADDRSRRIRTRIAEKALAEGNWDWLEAHMNGFDEELLKKVLMHCGEAGRKGLIDDYLDRISLSSAEACRLAQTVQDEELWETLLDGMEEDHRLRVLDYIGRERPESLSRFAQFGKSASPLETALHAMRNDGDVADAMRKMSPADKLELIRTALQEGYDDIDALIEGVDGAMASDVLEVMLDNGCQDCIGELASRASAQALPGMASLLVNRGLWHCLDELLSDHADVDLSEIWPMAINQQRWDLIDELALHGDENTLKEMSMALATLGRFDDLESFIEELDPDTLEQLLEKAMDQSDWEAIDRISKLLGE